MDKQGKLFELKNGIKVLESQEEIEKNVDQKTGQLSFISKEFEYRTILREELQPVTEQNILLKEKTDRLISAFEKAIPHFQNKMIGNEHESYLAYADNPEAADLVRVSSDKIPQETVYSFVSADLANAFRCKSCYVSMLLKDLNLWEDHRFVYRRKTGAKQETNFYRKSIVDEVYKRLKELITSNKILDFSEKRQAIYKQIFETMNFYRG